MEVSGQFHDPAALLSGKKSLVPIGYEAVVGSTAGLDVVVKRKILSPCRDTNH
jgi:hypothetical protein